MTKTGICSICKKHRWLGSKGKVCKPCGYKVGSCQNCKSKKKLYVDHLCYVCYQERQVAKHLSIITKNISFSSEYNNYLFELFLAYLKRYRLQYAHIKQTRELLNVLNNESISVISSWLQVYEYDKKYHIAGNNKKNGSAFMKIGYMLQELGVLNAKVDELGRQINTVYKVFNEQEKKWIDPFIQKKKNCTQHCQLHYLKRLKDLKYWMNDTALNITFLTVNSDLADLYFDNLIEKVSPAEVRKTKHHLDSIYRFWKQEKLILVNPWKHIETSREFSKVTVCSEAQVEQLFDFVKNPNSSPEAAMIITLALFFGLSNEDLCFATIDTQNDEFQIILRQKPLTCGKKYYNRNQTLTLPKKPDWFFKLQKRFFQGWTDHYSRVTKTYPNHYLILNKNLSSNRPLSKDAINKRMKIATQEATGIQVSPKILKQTCAYIFSRNQDAAILSTKGWAPESAFRYTWVTKQYFTESSSPKS